ncbi:MAG: TonB family protein [Candidatus Acidiferrales bacterium]
MAPLTKDSVEVANPAGNSAVSQPASQGKSSSALRSDALSLEVHVKVHGSRVIEVERGTAPKTEPFEEQTVTMIVFPQGAVLRMTTPVGVSQMLVLTNIKSNQDSICRVLKVRPNANHGSYVEVEFTHRQPGYWGVNFPSEGPADATPVASPQVNLESQQKQSAALPTLTPSPAAPVTRPAASSPIAKAGKPAAHVSAPKPESSFISIGSQETVQEAASATATTTKPLSPVERRIESAALQSSKNVPVVDPLGEAPLPPPSLSLSELQGDDDSDSSAATSTVATLSSHSQLEDSHEAPAAAVSPTSSREVFGNYAAASQAAPSEAFGARLDSSLGGSAAGDASSNQNWMLIAACIAVLVAGLGAGIAYFRQHPSTGAASSARTSSVAAQPAQGAASPSLPAITPAGQPYMAATAEPIPAPRSNAPNASGNAPAPANSGNEAKANDAKANEAKAPAANSNRSAASARQPAPSVTPDMMSSALTARPTTSTRGDEGQADSAPAIDPSVGASGTNALAGIASSNAASLPSPEMRPEGPVKIGGNVKAPRLISSVVPQYPSIARSSGQQGDVVVDTTINKSGNVVKMHVVSGPTSLRAAAMDALRRWKYEPSQLDGAPVEVQMQVTIKFRI